MHARKFICPTGSENTEKNLEFWKPVFAFA